MEIECEDGSTIALQSGSKTPFGRGSGFDTADRTVSRRHLLLGTDRQTGPSPRASFEVLGKNPVWVRRGDDDGISVFRRSDKGELAVGDWFCVAGHQPVWFALKGVQIEKGDDDGSERDSGRHSGLAELVDVSNMDPVKDFGFVVLGHEFDRYPNHMLRQVKDWEWFLVEPSKNSYDDEETKVRVLKKRKKRGRQGDEDEDDDDDEWTCEDERMETVQKQKYSTRSNDAGRSAINKNPTQKRVFCSGEEEDDDDTLGGFIVKDDDPEAEELSEVEEEEDEFIEDDE